MNENRCPCASCEEGRRIRLERDEAWTEIDRLMVENSALARELADARAELSAANEHLGSAVNARDFAITRIDGLQCQLAVVRGERDEAIRLLESIPAWGRYDWQNVPATVAAKLREGYDALLKCERLIIDHGLREAALLRERDEARAEVAQIREERDRLHAHLHGTNQQPDEGK